MNIFDQKKITNALYSKIPAFKCKEGCTDCCGPVPFNKYEWSKIADKPEAKKEIKSLDCPMIKMEGGCGCSIYEDRPLLCRMFGTVEKMKCPHGCGPEKMMSEVDETLLLKNYFKTLR